MKLPAPADLRDAAAAFLSQLPPDVPHVVAHIHHHFKPPSPDAVDSFEFGLDLILDGLERVRPASA